MHPLRRAHPFVSPSASAILLLLALGGCRSTRNDSEERFSGTIYFWHKFHREKSGLSDRTIRGLQFYPDREIVLRCTEDKLSGTAAGGRLVEKKIDEIREVIIPSSTAGAVRNVGREFLEVDFGDDLSLRFAIDDLSEVGDSVYFLTTDQLVFHHGKRLRVLRGEDARLRVAVDYAKVQDSKTVVLRGRQSRDEDRLALQSD